MTQVSYRIHRPRPWAAPPRCSEPTTDYLVVWPRLLDGIASVIDMWGSRWPYNHSRSPEEADLRGLWSDWAVVGNELKGVMRTHEQEQSKQLKLIDDALPARGGDLAVAERDS